MRAAWSISPWMPYKPFLAHIRDYDGTSPLDDSFGPVPGVYLMAHGDIAPPTSGEGIHLDPAVIYIGKAVDLRRRLRRHNKLYRGLNCYLARFNDRRFEKLFAAAFFCDNLLAITTRTPANKVLHAMESQKLTEYVARFSRRPILNARGGTARVAAVRR